MNEQKRVVLLAGSALLFVASVIFVFSEKLRDAYEVISIGLFPNAELAYQYGERHFDAMHPQAYDIGLAEHFFLIAGHADPNVGNVYHELARISFLRGNLNVALEQIDEQIQKHGDSDPSAYYVRGLIEGYKGDYFDAAKEYERFLTFQPKNWAALNDYAWVLLKANRPKDAYDAAKRGLAFDPSNPLLLNTSAIALYEMGDLKNAKIQAQNAVAAGKMLTDEEWLRAYPGNDPQIAGQGIETFQKAAEANMQTIIAATSSPGKLSI